VDRKGERPEKRYFILWIATKARWRAEASWWGLEELRMFFSKSKSLL